MDGSERWDDNGSTMGEDCHVAEKRKSLTGIVAC